MLYGSVGPLSVLSPERAAAPQSTGLSVRRVHRRRTNQLPSAARMRSAGRVMPTGACSQPNAGGQHPPTRFPQSPLPPSATSASTSISMQPNRGPCPSPPARCPADRKTRTRTGGGPSRGIPQFRHRVVALVTPEDANAGSECHEFSRPATRVDGPISTRSRELDRPPDEGGRDITARIPTGLDGRRPWVTSGPGTLRVGVAPRPR